MCFLFYFFIVVQGLFQEKEVLSPNIIQEQKSSNVQKQPSRSVLKKRRDVL